jgi:hypothetical protein
MKNCFVILTLVAFVISCAEGSKPPYYIKSDMCKTINSRYPYCVWSRVQRKRMCHNWEEKPGEDWSEHNGVECTKPRRASERRMTEHRLLDELLQRRMEELEEKTESLDGFGYRRLGDLYHCTRRGDKDCAKSGCFQALMMIKRMQKEMRDISINNICKMAVEDGQISRSFESACRYMARNHPQTSCKMARKCNCIKQTPASAGGGFGRL